MRRNERGQAVVEAALGTLLLVTILVFGIHFAEVGYLSLKVTEAANYATWDITARQMHEYSGSGTLTPTHRGPAVTSGQGAATDAYSDYDGRSSPAETRQTPTQVFTTATAITTTCTHLEGVGDFGELQLPSQVSGVYPANAQGGASCVAEATLNLTGIGSFHDSGGGYFRAQHARVTEYTICSINRAWGGDCQGEVMLALGDWGLSDTAGNEAEECELYDCVNTRYKEAVRRVFNETSGVDGSAVTLAGQVVGMSPISNGEYWFTYRGAPDFEQCLNGVHSGEDCWTVTPGGDYESDAQVYKTVFGSRKDCWLGLECDWSPRP